MLRLDEAEQFQPLRCEGLPEGLETGKIDLRFLNRLQFLTPRDFFHNFPGVPENLFEGLNADFHFFDFHADTSDISMVLPCSSETLTRFTGTAFMTGMIYQYDEKVKSVTVSLNGKREREKAPE